MRVSRAGIATFIANLCEFTGNPGTRIDQWRRCPHAHIAIYLRHFQFLYDGLHPSLFRHWSNHRHDYVIVLVVKFAQVAAVKEHLAFLLSEQIGPAIAEFVNILEGESP